MSELNQLRADLMALVNRVANLENRSRLTQQIGPGTVYNPDPYFPPGHLSPGFPLPIDRQQRVDKLSVDLEREPPRREQMLQEGRALVEIGREPNHTDVIQPCSCDEAVELRRYMHDALRALDSPHQCDAMREAAEMLRRGIGQ